MPASHDLLAADRGPGEPAASEPAGTRVLYVDDEPLMQRAVDRMLRFAGASALVAGTHEVAVALAAREPDLALAIVDFHMPDGPVGLLVERLQEAHPVLPVIGTSGSAAPSDFARHGVRRFLPKPWTLAELSRAVELAVRVRPGSAGLASPGPEAR